MRIGIQLAHVGTSTATPDAVRSSARAAEELGYDSVWVLDRLLAPTDPSVGYGGTDQPLPVEMAHCIDPLTALAYAAAVTDRVGLGTSVLCAPFYAPAVLARALTGIDVLSNGRLQVGLGQGWSPEELAAAGSSMKERGARLEELLDVLDAWWGADPVAHDGAHPIPPSVRSLKAVQRPRPPILLAAYGPAGLDRIARRADGWNPAGMPVAMLAPIFDDIRDLAAGYGRDPDALRLVVRANVHLTPTNIEGDERPSYCGSIDQVADDLAATAVAGAHEVILGLQGDDGLAAGLDVTLDAYAALAEGLEVRTRTAA